MVFLLLLLYSLVDLGMCMEATLLSKALSQFKDYNVAFYYDSTHFEALEHLLQVVEKNQPVYIINYDTSSKISELPQSSQLLHIVMLEKAYNLEKYVLTNDLSPNDIALIALKVNLNENQQRALCSRNSIRKAKAVFIFGLGNESLSVCCLFCEKEMITVRNIQRENGSVPDFNEFINNFTNFGGYTFRVGYDDFSPFFYSGCKDRECYFYGAEWNVIAITSKLFNYKYSLIYYPGNETNGASDVLIDQLRSGKIDWAIGGISQTLMRTKTKNIEYARYMQFQGYVAVYIHRDEWSNRWMNYLSAYWIDYLMTAGSVVAIAIITKLSLKYSKRYSASIGEYAIMAALYLLEQQSTKLKRQLRYWKPYIKLIFIFWLFACSSLIAYIKSIQTYILMTSPSGPSNIEELVASGYNLQIENDDFSNIKLHCPYSTSKYCFKLLKKMKVVKGVCVSIRSALNNKVAFIQEEMPLKYKVLKKCNLTIHQKQNLRFVPAFIIPEEWHAWPFQKVLPFISTFSHLINKLDASGLLQHWHAEYYNFYSKSKTLLRREKRILNMSDFYYPFGILIGGYFISTVIFLKEHLLIRNN